jgi:hypothetical protein
MYSSRAHRIIVAADVRRSLAIDSSFSRCPTPNVIVSRSELPSLLDSRFIGMHRSGEVITVTVKTSQ